jgi:hypothetical protein
MAEGLKTVVTVITPHATGADASEGEFWNAGLHHDVVQANTARAGGAQHLLLLGFASSK